MTTADDLKALIMPAVEAYADEIRDEATAPLESEIYDLNARLDADQKTIADLEAQIKALQPVKYVEYSDFAQQSSGEFLTVSKYLGAGVDKEVHRMKPNTSTKKSLVDALVKPNTNQYKLFRMSPAGAVAEVGGFTVEGTEQGHAYGGLVLQSAGPGSQIHDVKVTAIPGFDSGPPGETFALAVLRLDSSHLARIVVDGRKPDGSVVSASLLGLNYTTGKTVCDDSNLKYTNVAFAMAAYQCGDLEFNNGAWRFCRKVINIEQHKADVIDFNRIDFGDGALTVPYVGQFSSLTKSARITFRDCNTNGKPLIVRTYPNATGAMQKDSDFRCFVGGQEVTLDKTKFQIVHTG